MLGLYVVSLNQSEVNVGSVLTVFKAVNRLTLFQDLEKPSSERTTPLKLICTEPNSFNSVRRRNTTTALLKQLAFI